MSDYPEHEKLRTVTDRSHEIGAFLEWLRDSKGRTICEYRAEDDRSLDEPECCEHPLTDHEGAPFMSRPCTRCDCDDYRGFYRAEGFYPAGPSTIEAQLAEYFEIDLDLLESEKRAMLDKLREGV